MLENALNNRKETVFKILSIVLSSIFFAHIPLLLFLIYMGHHGFFSYDFFSDGLFGLKVFFFLTSIFVLITSLAIFWWVIPLIEKWKKGTFKLWPFIGISLFNLLFLLIIVVSIPKNGDYFRVAYVLAIGFFVSIHVAFLIHAKPSEQFRSLIGVIFIITFMSLHLREQASSVLAIGLKSYAVGGGIGVILKPKLKQNNNLTGNLLLTSPKHIYIKLDGEEEISTIDRSKVDAIQTKHNKKIKQD